MQQSKRTDVILEHVKKHKHATIQELVDITSSSAATIRRDVNKLAEDGQVYRHRGGISFGRSISRQPTTAEKMDENLAAKKAIAVAALGHIKEGMTVFLDAGTTSFELSKLLINRHDVTVITTDLRIAFYLSEAGNNQIIIAGGNIDNCSQSVVGDYSGYLLDNIIPDICFCTCSAFDTNNGVTSPTQEKAFLKRKLATLGKSNILLTDSSKLHCVGTHRIAPLSTYDLLISDSDMPSHVQADIEEEVAIELVQFERPGFESK
ncbi:DeoR family transcriptional regulator [Photobacterium rosenbergii]|uniref:DeoR family transcriptional regulator n=1 Tax=Photobacterium rosenbergii TaxID=294936 RepID=A0A2T3N9P9_9GAMM|nr:DeoR/GlpR family DNA-binding transcription regulator [Photobacterium rosenbergii]PSW10243.1 DeoR family transcriptional regulator [Photobacterium rosenbergii]